jgi:hypothetical protein
VSGRRDEFLSEEDLDLRNLPLDEVLVGTASGGVRPNPVTTLDWHLYRHGVFTVDPRWEGPPPPRDRFL